MIDWCRLLSMRKPVDQLSNELTRELHEARETIISLVASHRLREVLSAYHCTPADYMAKVQAAVLESDFGENVATAWDRRERFRCPLCREPQTLPAGMEMHIGVDGRGRMKLCKVFRAGLDLCRERLGMTA